MEIFVLEQNEIKVMGGERAAAETAAAEIAQVTLTS